MSGCLVSCIIPCFDGERYLDEAIRSILAQTHRPLEIIVVDDGSTDGSAHILRGYGDAVRHHRQENAGPGAACNKGVTLAAGDYIAFLEQDDLWLADKTTRQLEAFRKNPELRYCVGHVQNFWIPELAAEAARHRDHPVMQPVPGYVVQTLMVRRDVFEMVGAFDETLRFAFASEWFMRAAEAGAAGALVPEVLTRRRLHHSNYSRMNREASRDQFLHVLKATLDRRRGRGPLT
ncbi:MAG TPA: glycosyltransferase family A protein [Longimicrobiales bacterium]|nr:glycosyltransferase family A protein [Longimicrobiales bacterium]